VASLVVAACSLGCAGIYVDLNATGYPALRATPKDSAPEVGPKPLGEARASTAVGVTFGIELDDGRSSRWAFGTGFDAFNLGANGSARHRFNDLRLDVTLKTIDDETRLRLAVGGGIGAGTTRLVRDDGSAMSHKAASARLYSGPVFVRYAGNHFALSLMLGGAYVILGDGDYDVRGWGLTTHVTMAYTFADTHADVALYDALVPGVHVSDYANGALKIGCRVDTAAPEQAHAVCDEGEIELHVTALKLHAHCSRSTEYRCRALLTRIKKASVCPPGAACP